METAVIVKIAVSAAPYSIDKPYDYLVPDEFTETAVPGVRVTVPFGKGNRTSEGMILARNDAGEKSPKLKPIQTVLDREPVLDEDEIGLAIWMRQRYFCTLFDAIKAILPAGIWYRFRETWSLTQGLYRDEAESKSANIKDAAVILEMLYAHNGHATLEELKSACGDDVAVSLRALRKTGVLHCETDSKRKVNDKMRRMVELSICAEDALALTEGKKKTSQRYEVVRLLASSGRIAAAALVYFTGVSMQTLRAMEKAGIVAFTEEEELRIPAQEQVTQGDPIILNEEQQTAYDEILCLTQSNKAEAVLLHGVTGSGKTQIYLRLVEEVLKQGRTAIVLVPEIVLTPQMMRKFTSYFGEKVAMLHSSLRMTERYDQWKRIRRGEVSVVLGTRSAIFAPLKQLGLVILDEEQENSYQSETPPRYHTSDIAKYLCARDQAVLLLGSATPTIETTWAAEQGSYHKTTLQNRYNAHSLPQVTIADLRDEIRSGNTGMVGEILRYELAENLKRGEQSILFLNRRGSSRMLLCGECGHVPECPRCSVPMTFHSANGRLMCHYCGHSERFWETCPECGGFLKHVGAGTQRVEEELRELFPDAGILRMDADTTSCGHDKILKTFETEQVPILLGTQMVAKGLDFENVTLVGVLSADTSLYLDHYRAAERTFSLLTQVVGRAGRGNKRGRAVIQTYTPQNDVIQSAAQQDYQRFYESEIRMRRMRRYPPFADLFTFTVSGTEEGLVLRAAADVREQLRRIFSDSEYRQEKPEILGPAPAPILKLNNRYRYRVLLVGRNDKETRSRVSWLLKAFASDRANRGLNIFVDCNTTE